MYLTFSRTQQASAARGLPPPPYIPLTNISLIYSFPLRSLYLDLVLPTGT